MDDRVLQHRVIVLLADIDDDADHRPSDHDQCSQTEVLPELGKASGCGDIGLVQCFHLFQLGLHEEGVLLLALEARPGSEPGWRALGHANDLALVLPGSLLLGHAGAS